MTDEPSRQSSLPEDSRRLSPNIQIYRPQLTSVLSIANRVTGVASFVGAVGLVAWLCAIAAGPVPYASARTILQSPGGQLLLWASVFAFFFHLIGGIRHLVWDTLHGFDLRSIYISGWSVVATSAALTLVVWAASHFAGGR
jgi:succinate dehydrogenase / fumarate reductase cytochrome b subunit